MSKRSAFAVLSIILAATAACGAGRSDDSDGTGFVSLDAGKRTSIQIPASPVMIPDSSQSDGSSLSMDLPIGRTTLHASLLQGQGVDPGSRVDALVESGFGDASTIAGNSRTGAGIEFVAYSIGDSCHLERIWPRGGNEALILSVEGAVSDPAVLLAQTEQILSRAVPMYWDGLRTPILSDRSMPEICADLQDRDVSLPPSVNHDIDMLLIPQEQAFEVVDSFSIVFPESLGLDRLRLSLPHIDASAQEMVFAVQGTCMRETDSILCKPDPDTGVFEGVYSSRFDDYYREEGGFVRGQIRLSCSFSCGEWFYPGSRQPADYNLEVTVPFGGDFYCSLNHLESSVEGASSLYRFESPVGGISEPLAWASGDLSFGTVASGRSRFVHIPIADEGELGLAAEWADRLAGTLWDRLGFEGGSLDIILVESIDRPVLAAGPGCLLVSPQVISSIRGFESWDDSLSAGIMPSGPRVVARAARALLAMSTYLPEELSCALSAWAAYLFIESHGSAEDAGNMLDSFRRFYLSRTAESDAIEFAVADPMLSGSELAEPVLLGKAPCVFTMFSEFIPGFDPGLRSALGNMRHSGIAFFRLGSVMGTPDDPSLEDLYSDWMTLPGVPQVIVQWSDSSGRIEFLMEQIQPGPDFPLPLGRIVLQAEDGQVSEGSIYGPDADGVFWSPSGFRGARVAAIDISPSRCLPADFIYERSP